MESPTTWLDRLKTLAASERVPLSALGTEGLEDLLTRGLIQKDERPRQASLEARYEALQEMHRHFLEARGCVDRLQRRLAPRSRLAELIPPGAPARPGPEDPDVQKLLGLLEVLKIQVRGAEDAEGLLVQLNRVHDYLQVEGRECLDRLADTDREIDLIRKQSPPGTLVDSVGFFTLTGSGEAALPEARVVSNFEAALQTAFGTGALRGASYAHFREDAASLLSFLMEGMARGQRPSAVVSEYEALLEAYERIAPFNEIRSTRAKIHFLVRLLRATRDEPKLAYYWCNRERLQQLLERMRSLTPPSVAASGWHLPYATDLFLADGGIQGDEEQAGHRSRLFEAIQRSLSDLMQDIRIADGQFVRLGLTLTHVARGRNFVPGILLNRFVTQAFETITEAAHSAPYDLGDRGTRLLFGTHLAHVAGFTAVQLRATLEAFRALQEHLEPEGHEAPIPPQVQLHAFATLDRLDRLGTPMPLQSYRGLFARLQKRLSHHKIVAKALRTEQTLTGDEAALISNLAALVCFQATPLPADARRYPDVGMAGLYEEKQPGLPPLLGGPFGTLMLA